MGLFIPKKIRVGFSARKDTFTGKLAYVIYYDEKGKIRKEGSFNSWREEALGTLELDNEPQGSFVINKGVKRDNYWGSARTMARIHDDRGFEFEITITNLIGILMHSDVSKRDIQERCVYAWNGTELVLLPCNSQEYIEAQEFTKLQEVNTLTKDLSVGAVYNSKKGPEERFVYLGAMAWEGPEKKQVFYDLRRKEVKLVTLGTLALFDSNVHPQLAEFMADACAAQSTRIERLSPKHMKIGGVYTETVTRYAYPSGDKKTINRFVYIGQYSYLLNPGADHETYRRSAKTNEFKKRSVFFDLQTHRFRALMLSQLDMELEPVMVENPADFVKAFEATCVTSPVTGVVVEPMVVDSLSFCKDVETTVWVARDIPNANEKDTRYILFGVKEVEGKGGAEATFLLTPKAQTYPEYFYWWNTLDGKKAHVGDKEFYEVIIPKDNGKLTLQELQDLNPFELYATTDDGQKVKREIINTPQKHLSV